MDWESKFKKALCSEDIGSAINVLEQQSTSHAGTPPTVIKSRAVNLLRDSLPDSKLELWAEELANNTSSTAKELACSLLVYYFPAQPHLVQHLMIRLADDPNWEVRESAAQTFGAILTNQFKTAYPLFEKLVIHKSSNVRRAIAVAVKYAAKKRNPEWGPQLLNLIEPLLTDPTEYVRKNLGPFTLGDGLLRCYPKLTMASIKKWAQSRDEVVRWNVAMCLSTAEARKHLGEALLILGELATDDRRFVWRAVASALKNHARSTPQQVLPVVRKWMSDPTRRPAAEVVCRYVT